MCFTSTFWKTLRELLNLVVPSVPFLEKSHHLVNCSIRLIKISFDIVHSSENGCLVDSEKSRRSDSAKHLKLTKASKRKR